MLNVISEEAASRSRRSTLTNIASHLTAELAGELVRDNDDDDNDDDDDDDDGRWGSTWTRS